MKNEFLNIDDCKETESHRNSVSYLDIRTSNLQVDCKKCFGLCCVSLYFSAMEGFPSDKEAGKPCMNLQSDFSCSVHKDLRKQGLKGCTAYDCFGAGQKVAQITYAGHDWRQVPESAKQMFEVFLIMRQLHEMLWYLTAAISLQPSDSIKAELNSILNETEGLTLLSSDSLMKLDLIVHRAKVNQLLFKTSELIRNKFNSAEKSTLKRKNNKSRKIDYIGVDLRKTNLRGANLSGSWLMAADLRGVDLSGADLIGADLRDADLRGANLKDTIFLTQAQINSAKGNADTKLPKSLCRPFYWSE